GGFMAAFFRRRRNIQAHQQAEQQHTDVEAGGVPASLRSLRRGAVLSENGGGMSGVLAAATDEDILALYDSLSGGGGGSSTSSSGGGGSGSSTPSSAAPSASDGPEGPAGARGSGSWHGGHEVARAANLGLPRSYVWLLLTVELARVTLTLM